MQFFVASFVEDWHRDNSTAACRQSTTHVFHCLRVLRALLIGCLTLLADWSSLVGAVRWQRHAIWKRLRHSQALLWPGAISAVCSMHRERYGWPFTTSLPKWVGGGWKCSVPVVQLLCYIDCCRICTVWEVILVICWRLLDALTRPR